MKIPSIKAGIYFYDDPPNVQPHNKKMVAFTSPNHAWFSFIRKDVCHSKMHMPFWTLDELLTAKEALELGLDEGTICERFRVLGGVKRYCLSHQQDCVEEARSTFDDNLGDIKSCYQIIDMLKEK